MNDCDFLAQFDRTLEENFNPPYLEVLIPSDMKDKLLLASKEFIVDEKSVHAPSKVIVVPCKSKDFESEEVKKLIKEYDAISFGFDDGKIFLDINLDTQK
jgi:hypothetical protein